MYYNMSESCITDKQFDYISQQLVMYMNTTPKEVLEQTRYWYVFNDFDGSTGFDLPYRLTDTDREYLTQIATMVIKSYNKSKGKGGKRVNVKY